MGEGSAERTVDSGDWADLTASDAARAIAAGQLLSEELVGACLAAIDAREPAVLAWQHLDRERALAQARHCDELRRSGAMIGPLHGVPVGLKDIIDTVDLPTENGSVLDAGRQPNEDATLVTRLRAAGAVILGKTVTTEFACYTPGKTRNPHDGRHTPGGSSSGSAAAVAAGMTPLAIGTQTNGSVIRPASFCGVVGFKPSFGLISRHGVLRTSRSLDQVGVFSRTVGDAALAVQVLAGQDTGDPDTRLASTAQLLATAAAAPPMPPRFGVLRSALWDQADDDTRGGLDELAAELGERCIDLDLGATALVINQTHLTVMQAEMAWSLQAQYQRGRERISARLAELIEAGGAITAVAYQQALEQRRRLALEFDAWFDECDALLLPAAPGAAPAGLDATGSPVFCSLASLLGLPAISLPLLVAGNGLPIGVQLVGRFGDDGRLLRTANWLVRRLATETGHE